VVEANKSRPTNRADAQILFSMVTPRSIIRFLWNAAWRSSYRLFLNCTLNENDLPDYNTSAEAPTSAAQPGGKATNIFCYVSRREGRLPGAALAFCMQRDRKTASDNGPIIVSDRAVAQRLPRSAERLPFPYFKA
jgi:hypothetical protein